MIGNCHHTYLQSISGEFHGREGLACGTDFDRGCVNGCLLCDTAGCAPHLKQKGEDLADPGHVRVRVMSRGKESSKRE